MTNTADLTHQLFQESPYQAYVYGYPHKTAYRPLNRPVTLNEAWVEEDLKSLYLYIHIPFCEMRCGFCNLFTTTGAKSENVDSYLDAFKRQATATWDQLGSFNAAGFAIGGGTPTFLSASQLEDLFTTTQDILGVRPELINSSVETSPATATEDRLRVLKDAGVDRISIGIQSFNSRDARAIGRFQRSDEVSKALQQIRSTGFETLNIDLIYGGEQLSKQSWLDTISRTLEWQPEQIYLYPLYVRPLTGLGKSGRSWDDVRLDAYRRGRDALLTAGYEQVSMRMFRLKSSASQAGPFIAVSLMA